nr:nucleobase-ascorbate transporter 5-like [Physcomitrium patens]|eukprot:XP_024378510.1 nucleobase-ascorbate transporter 5-like [Physcomitrella patens]
MFNREGVEQSPKPADSHGVAVLLGFQNYITMLGTSVLIPVTVIRAIGREPGDLARTIQSVLFVTAINTLVQTGLGSRLPTVMGSSFYFLPMMLSIVSRRGIIDYPDPNEVPHILLWICNSLHINGDTMLSNSIFAARNEQRFLRGMRATQGGFIAGSALNIVLGFSGLWGVAFTYISPIVIAPITILVGLGIFEHGFPGVAKCVEIGIPALLLFLLFSKRRCLFCYCPDSRNPYPLQWGAPTFTAGDAFGIMTGGFASLLESTGEFYSLSRLSGATPPPSYIISRGIGWQGIGLLFNGFWGTSTGTTVAPENVGLVGLTRVGSRRVAEISAGFMLFFSIFGKFGAVLASIPQPIVTAFLCINFGVVVGTGISMFQFANMNSTRNIFVVGFSLFMGLSVPQYFNEFSLRSGHGPVNTNSPWFNNILSAFFSSSMIVCFVVGTVLDTTLTRHVSKWCRVSATSSRHDFPLGILIFPATSHLFSARADLVAASCSASRFDPHFLLFTQRVIGC